MDADKSKSSTGEQRTHRLIWTTATGKPRISDLLTRDEALRQFANLTAIRNACTPHSGRRLRVVAENERLDAIRQRVAAALVAL